MSFRALALGLLVAIGCNGDAPVTQPDAAGSTVDAAPPPSRAVAYVSGYSPNIAWYDVDKDTGALTMAGQIAAFAGNPSFLAIRTDTRGIATHLYAVSESTSRVGAYSIDPASGALAFINDVSTGGNGPAHVSVDRAGQYVLVANYGDGSVSVFPVRADGGVAAASQTLTAGANAHQIVADPQNTRVLVPCKGASYIAQYDFASGMLTPSSTPRVMTAAGAGPRHVAWGSLATSVYLINENNSTLTAFDDQATTGLRELTTVSSRAGDASGSNTGAEVVVDTLGGDMVYVSNRGDNNIGVFKPNPTGTAGLSPIAHVPTGGTTPRMIELHGRSLYAANQDSNSVTLFHLDAATRVPMPTGTSITFTKPTYIGFASLPAQD